jgi:hypothetical protein
MQKVQLAEQDYLWLKKLVFYAKLKYSHITRHHIYQLLNLLHPGNQFNVLHAECSLLQVGNSGLC